MRKIIKLFTLLILGSSLFISACNSDEKLSNQKNDLITYVDEEIDTLESSLITKIDETIAKINALEEKHDAKVLELEDIDKSIKEVQDAHTNEINSLNDELDSLVAQYETKISELESKDKELKDSLSALELEIANQNELNEAKHNSLTSEIEKANSDLAKLEEDYNNDVTSLNDNLGLLQKELDDFELQVENQDKANAETHNNLLQDIYEITNQITALDNKYKAETDTLKERQRTLQDELNVLEERIENNETIDVERYNELLEEISSLNEELSALSTKHNNEVKTLSDNLNLLQKELDDFELQVENQDKANAETHSSLLQSITNVTNELSALDTKHNNDVTSLNTKLDSLQNELNELETLMSEQDKLMKEEYTSLVNQLEEVDKEIKEVNENQNKNIKEIEDNIALVNETHERDIETLTNQKNEIIEEINTIKTDIESLNSNLSKEISDVKTSLNLLESMLKNEDTRLQGEITKLNNLVDTLSTLIETNNGKINELQQELGYLKSEVEDLRNELEEKVCDEHNVLDWELVEVLEDGTKIYVQKCDKCDTIIDMNIEKYEGEYVYDHNVHYIINEDGTYSNANNHIFIDEYCVECGVHESIAEMNFELNENGVEYSLIGLTTTYSRDVVIPSEYKGLPVTSIEEYAITNYKKSIVIPESITNIARYGIYKTNTTIYLKHVSIPEGFENNWYTEANCYVGYGKGEYFVELQIDGNYRYGAYVNKGDMLPNFNVPNTKGYIFTGFYDQTGTKYYDENMNCVKAWDKEENGTLYAQWESETYTIIFDANGGEGEMESMEVTYEEAFNDYPLLLENKFTNGSKIFMGWSLYEDGEAMYDDELEVCEVIYDVNPTNNEEIRLYAIWKVKTANIRIGVDNYDWIDILNEYFKNNPIEGITVEVVYEGSYDAVNRIAELQEEMPDIQLAVDRDIVKYADSLADLGSIIENKLDYNSVEKFVEPTTVDNKAKYVPIYYDGMAFAYNKTMLAALGVDVSEINEKGLPTSLDTFEEIFSLAEYWATNGYKSYKGKEITTAVSLVTSNSWSGYAFVSAGGWKIFRDENNPTDAGFRSPEFKAGLEFIAAAADAKVKVIKSGMKYSLAQASLLSQEQSSDLLNDMTSPMALVGTWENVAWSNAVSEGDEIVFAAMPTWNGYQPGPFTKTLGFVINGYSADIEAAREVLDLLYSEELLQNILGNTSQLIAPVLKNDADFKLELSDIQLSMSNAFQYGYSEVNTAMPNNPSRKVMDAYYGIGPENFYMQAWDKAAANTGDAREAWLDAIVENIATAFDMKCAELNGY